MTLQRRLDDARDDYRTLEPPPPVADPMGERARRWPLLTAVAAVLLIGAVSTVAVLATRDDTHQLTGTGPPEDDGGSPAVSTVEPSEPADPDPPGAVAPYDPRIQLDPAGPYTDGQQITLRVPRGYANLPNDGVMCAVVADAPGAPGEWCDPRNDQSSGAGNEDEAPVTLHQRVFTPTGWRDCNEPAVTCRLIARTPDNQPRASAPLVFEGEAQSPSVDLQWSTAEPEGSYEVRALGAAPDPSWLELRETDPQRAEGFPPFYLQICAFSASERTPGPFGGDIWAPEGNGDGGPYPLPPANCDTLGQWDSVQLDPDDPERPVQVVIPAWIYGYQGWSDCRVAGCFMLLRQSDVSGFTPDGSGLMGGDRPVAAALLEPEWVEPDARRPSMRVDTPGPHRPGQEVVVTVAGLPDGHATNIGVCNVEGPWACGYIGSLMGLVGNGQHTVWIPETMFCPPRSCYLELDSQGEGLPPLAVAPLDTPA